MRLSIQDAIGCVSGSSLLLGRQAIAWRGASAALAISALLSSALPSSAAPIRGSVDRVGFIRLGGLTGEVYVGIRGPAEILLPQNRLPAPGEFITPFPPDGALAGEISYLGLSGLQSTLDMGYVVQRTASTSQLAKLKMIIQSSFTSDIIEVPLRLTPGPPPDPNSPSFVYLIPEPATGAIATVGLSVIAVRDRRTRR